MRVLFCDGQHKYVGLFALSIFGSVQMNLTVVCATFMGACLGFLWFNCFPADVFMGDFGALLLGGVLMTVAFLLHQEAILLISGGIFLFQFFTSAIQDYSFLRRKG